MVIKRSFFTDEGEPLVVSPSPVQAALRLQAWIDFSGAPEGVTLLSPMCSVPLPVYPEVWTKPHRRWPGTSAAAMWHPLMWLPQRIAGRYVAAADEPLLEGDDLWAARVAYELTASGLYDEATGAWTDVLSLIDIDIDDPASLERVQRWLDGADDRELDDLDLTPIFDEVAEQRGDEDWARKLAEAEIPSLRIVAWASASEALLDHCEDITNGTHHDLDELRFGGELLASLASGSFAQLPPTPSSSPDETAWWLDLADRIGEFTGSAADLVSGPFDTMVGRLMEIREDYWPRMEELASV